MDDDEVKAEKTEKTTEEEAEDDVNLAKSANSEQATEKGEAEAQDGGGGRRRRRGGIG